MGNGRGARLSQEGEEVNLRKGPVVMLRVLPLVQSNSSVSSLTLSLPVSLGVETSLCGRASGNVWSLLSRYILHPAQRLKETILPEGDDRNSLLLLLLLLLLLSLRRRQSGM